MKLTRYFIKKKVQLLASTAPSRKHAFCSLEEATRILVLYQAEDSGVVEPCLETLRMKQKQVSVCVYVSAGTIPEADDSHMYLRENEDLDMWFVPNADSINRFNALAADILIDLTHTDCYPMQALLLQHPCSFRVGAKHERELYDLTISVTERNDIKHLFGHILFYLQSIRSK